MSATRTFHSYFRPFQQTHWMKSMTTRSQHDFRICVAFVKSFVKFVVQSITGFLIIGDLITQALHANRTRMIINKRLIFRIQTFICWSSFHVTLEVVHAFKIMMVSWIKNFRYENSSNLIYAKEWNDTDRLDATNNVSDHLNVWDCKLILWILR